MSNTIREVFKNNFVRLMREKGSSNKDVADFMNVSPTTVGNWAKGYKVPRMDKLDMLCTFFGVERTDLTMPVQARRGENQHPIPLIGTIACGVPIPAQTDIQGVVVPDKKIRATFALRAKGDSMINVGIADGDVVFVREQAQVEEGEIAAVYIDGEATLKKFYRHGDAVELRPANDSMRSMYFSAENCSEFRILGKCVGYMHGFE